MFDVLARYFSAVFVLTFLASFGMSPEASVDENAITAMKAGAIFAVVMGLCINWKDYKG